MEKNKFIDRVFKASEEKGIEEFEIYFLSNASTSLKVYNGEVESFTDNQNQGISFRGKFNGKVGYAFTESFDEEDIEYLIEEARGNGEVIENLDEEIIYGEKKEYREVKNYSEEIESISIEEIKKFLMDMERYTKSLDPRIKNVNACGFVLGKNERIIKNSKGINLSDKGNIAYTYVSISVEEEGKIKTGFEYKLGKKMSDFSYEELGNKVVREAVSKLDITDKKIKNKNCIIENLAFSSLLESMGGIFIADAVQKGYSKLKGKLGEKIASSKINLVDDPFLEDGYGNSSFDAEGVPTEYKKIIENGILKTYLYNLKTAKKDNVESTGNASKGSYKGTMGTSSFNLYVEKGDKSIEKLYEELGEGVLITSFAGLHSGLNSISGDFSLAGEGYYIKDGKKQKALNQITVASNFFELLQNIKEVANDLDFTLSSVGSPSVLVSDINIEMD